MRVLMTTDVVGGVWTFTQELAGGLLERDCEVALVGLGAQPSREQRRWSSAMEERWGGSFSFLAIDAPLEWMLRNDRAFTEAAPSMLRLADEWEPDVVHANQFCFGALPLSTPKVVTAHSDVLSWAACCRGGLLEDSRWLREYRSLVSAGLDGCDVIAAPTRWMLAALREHFDLPEGQHVIPNGRKINFASPHPERKLQAVTAGRLWDEAKNISMLSEIESPIPIFIAGQTRSNDASAKVPAGATTLLGELSQEQLLALFRESAIYLCTSQYEPFGLAPLEAALCGCAVLANDIPSLREVWGDGAVYFDGPERLTSILGALHVDRRQLAELQGRSLAQAQKYSREAMAAAYLSTYEVLAAQKRELVHVA